MWDMRSKAQIHCLEGHTNTVAAVKCQEVEPQVNLFLLFKVEIYLLLKNSFFLYIR